MLPLKEKRKKLPPGRPKKDEGQRKTRCVKVYMDDDTYRLLDVKSRTSGLPKSVMVCNAIKGIKVKERLPKEFNNYSRNVSGIANNLNQLAREAHKNGMHGLESRLNRLMERMEAELVGISQI